MLLPLRRRTPISAVALPMYGASCRLLRDCSRLSMIWGEEILPAKVVYTLAMLSRSMARNVSVAVASLLILSIRTPAQQFPPGYVDPAPLLAAASKEIGEANLKCITYSGTGYGGAVGQTYENAVNVDWPRIDTLANYTRTI